MPVQQVAPVTCPNCKAQFTAPLENVIDGQDLAMKSAFLQGRLNVIQCPQCGYTGAPTAPILYYDQEKELSFVHVPTDLTLTGADQEKIIGDLTNKLFNSLPAEERKFYLLNPKTFLTMDSMIKAILEADGITEEMLKAQEAKAKLVQEFARAPDEAALKELVKKHDAELDRDFFELMTGYLQSAYMAGDQQGMQSLLALRTLIARMSSRGKEIVAEIDKELGIMVMASKEELLERLEAAKDDQEFEALVANGHPLLDYEFFQQLTAKIDAAVKAGDTERAQTLRALRTRVLDIKSEQEAASRAAMEKAADLLQKIVQSDAPEKLIDKKLEEIDDAFFFVLQANIEEARRQGHEEPAKSMEALGHLVMSKLQQRYGETPQPEATPQTTEQTPQIHIATR